MLLSSLHGSATPATPVAVAHTIQLKDIFDELEKYYNPLRIAFYRNPLVDAAALRCGICLHRAARAIPQGKRSTRGDEGVALHAGHAGFRAGLDASGRAFFRTHAGDPAGTGKLDAVSRQTGPSGALCVDGRRAVARLAIAQRSRKAGPVFRSGASGADRRKQRPREADQGG